MKESVSFEEVHAQVKELLSQANLRSDKSIWIIACAIVAVAGHRAASIKNEDINAACMRFIEEMHLHAGTPSVKETVQ